MKYKRERLGNGNKLCKVYFNRYAAKREIKESFVKTVEIEIFREQNI